VGENTEQGISKYNRARVVFTPNKGNKIFQKDRRVPPGEKPVPIGGEGDKKMYPVTKKTKVESIPAPQRDKSEKLYSGVEVRKERTIPPGPAIVGLLKKRRVFEGCWEEY